MFGNIPLRRTVFQIGMRDISIQSQFSASPPAATTSQLMEFYWDIILLIESQFLCKEITFNQFKQFRKFYLINAISQKFTSSKLNQKSHLSSNNWRSIADNYLLLYFNNATSPQHNILLSKQINDCLNIIIPSQFNFLFNHIISQNKLKDWLISMLEFTDSLNLSNLKLYLNRDLNHNNINHFLQNLNWINGKIISNEDRLNSNDYLNLDDLLLTDENFIILQFDI